MQTGRNALIQSVLTNVKLLGDAAHRLTVVSGHVFRICNTASHN